MGFLGLDERLDGREIRQLDRRELVLEHDLGVLELALQLRAPAQATLDLVVAEVLDPSKIPRSGSLPPPDQRHDDAHEDEEPAKHARARDDDREALALDREVRDPGRHEVNLVDRDDAHGEDQRDDRDDPEGPPRAWGRLLDLELDLDLARDLRPDLADPNVRVANLGQVATSSLTSTAAR